MCIRDSPYALQMLAAILDGHDAARFNKKLVREDKVALSVGIDYDNSARGPGMIYLYGSPSAGKTIADLQAALRAEIKRIQQAVSYTHLDVYKRQTLLRCLRHPGRVPRSDRWRDRGRRCARQPLFR